MSTCYLKTSDDEGTTFNAPISVASGYIFPAGGKDMVGRLWCFMWKEPASGSDSDLYFTYSDDDGATWETPAQVTTTTDLPAQKAGVELDDITGRIWVSYIRGGAQKVAYSDDQGQNWAEKAVT